MPKFKDPRIQEAYLKARQMHDTLFYEESGRGMAYRKGWHGRPYGVNWTSWCVYAAGRDNRAEREKSDD